MDGFAYVAFTQNERALASESCTPGSEIEPGNVQFSRDDRVILWQIHGDGKYRTTTVEESKGRHSLSEPGTAAAPTGAPTGRPAGGVPPLGAPRK